MNRWRRVFLPFAVGYWFSYFVRNVNAVIVPELARDLGLGASGLGLLTSVFLVSFALVQLPLGLLLDRYGARRVEAGFLGMAALGCVLFASGQSLGQLMFARMLIGIGVAACLMAAFKTFGEWFGRERQASLNASIMFVGVLGGLTASSPLAWLAGLYGWRVIFVFLAVLALLCAALVLTTPEQRMLQQKISFRQQLDEFRGIFYSRAFWRLALPAALFIGGFVALQGLWAVPWLMEFNGYSREVAADHLLLLNLGLLLGYFLIASSMRWLSRHGLGAERLLRGGLACGLVIPLLILLDIGPSKPLWFCYGFVYAVANLMYSQVQQQFPPALAGRANTALNLLAFLGAFACQWGFGIGVDGLRQGGYTVAEAYRTSFAALLMLQAVGWLWLRRGTSPAERADPCSSG